jgi:Zn-dependent protease with chaperone function
VPVDGSGGLFLSLLTESFAVRAFVGSLAAAALAALAVGSGAIRSTRARRLVVLAPVLAAAVAGFASMRAAEAYLPQLWIATAGTAGAAGEVLDFLGELAVVATDGRIDLLVLAYSLVVSVLVTRRACGMLAVRRMLRRAHAPAGHGYVIPVIHRLARRMEVADPRVVLLEQCPGGAFTAGFHRPVVALDPVLLDNLDARELEGLLAHELAHIKRRDILVGGLVGLFRDLTFFLPPVHLAVRWLRGEQEESADELASGCTRRPAALASSILKVWDCSKGRRPMVGACAALGGGRRLALVSGTASPGPVLGERTRAIATRIERLIQQAPTMPRWRPGTELVLAVAVLLTASSAAVVLPRWIAADFNAEGLAIGGLGAAPAASVESPAFATFRVLTHPGTAPPEQAVPADQLRRGRPLWPTVETRGQLHAGVPAAGSDAHRMLWAGAGQDPWEVSTLREQALPARPLWTLSDTGPQLGLFVLGKPQS